MPSCRTCPEPTATAAVAEYVHALRDRTRRRLFPTRVQLVTADPTRGPAHTVADEPVAELTAPELADLDHALRVELLLAGIEELLAAGMLAAPDAVALVVIRPGRLEPAEGDLAWWRALVAAAGIADVAMSTVYAVTRRGWLDVADPHPVLVSRRRRPGSGSQCPSSSRYSGEVRRKVS